MYNINSVLTIIYSSMISSKFYNTMCKTKDYYNNVSMFTETAIQTLISKVYISIKSSKIYNMSSPKCYSNNVSVPVYYSNIVSSKNYNKESSNVCGNNVKCINKQYTTKGLQQCMNIYSGNNVGSI